MAVQNGYAGSRNRWREVSISSVSFPLSVLDYRAAAAVVAAIAFLTSPPFVGGQPGAPGSLIFPKTMVDRETEKTSGKKRVKRYDRGILDVQFLSLYIDRTFLCLLNIFLYTIKKLIISNSVFYFIGKGKENCYFILFKQEKSLIKMQEVKVYSLVEIASILVHSCYRDN
ncbi:hypothetical protein ALC56_01139 [Trachymyrmex septentrionalis]|uniref:Uncharacterized protein n=1 Tax=Trachymyrmex septentrionalis TaxID=34720 RepID=A0A195FVI9_9HYME|nr:hypothetical protein ALC56_01139 [Trachymyrmex septentrionalis]